MRNLKRTTSLGLIFSLSACGVLPFLQQTERPATAPLDTVASLPEDGAGAVPENTTVTAPAPPPEARTVEQFDTTTEQERAEAAAPPPAPQSAKLGTTIASLGDPSLPGFWAETPLVTEVQPGRLDFPSQGTSVQVELRPSGGAPGSGTRVSLPALRVLEAPLTALPELEVFGL